MPKRITYLEARADKSEEAFRAHWSTTHADIARHLPGVTAYRQNHVLESVPGPQMDSPYRVDGIVELWFGDDDVVQAGFASDVADKLIVDEQNFLRGLTGGPVTAGLVHPPWPYKLWVLARWNPSAQADPDAVERWAEQLFKQCDGAIGWGVNVLIPGAELLVRDALRSEEQIPEVAVAIGFADQASVREAGVRVGQGLEGAQKLLSRVYACVAEELIII